MNVHKIKINLYDPDIPKIEIGTQGSYGVEAIDFELGPEWDSLTCNVSFLPVGATQGVSVIYTGAPILVPAEVMAVVGHSKMIIDGVKDNKIIKSKTIRLYVSETMERCITPAPEPTPSTYAQVVDMMAKQAVDADAAEAAQAGAEAAELRVIAIEAEAREREDIRQANETARQTAEGIRVSNESERISAESSRGLAESGRVSAESARQSAESARASAESARASAESGRASAETSRVNAENARQTKWGGVDATATQLPEGGEPTADVNQDEHGTHFQFGIPKGDKGDTGNGITSVVLNPDYTLTISFDNDTTHTTDPIRGATGNGIATVAKTETVGNVDTYTIEFTNGTTTTFDVTNGVTTVKIDGVNQSVVEFDSDPQTQLDGKADKSYVDDALALKADKTVVDKKAEQTSLNATNKRLDNIAQLLAGNAYSLQDGDSPAYSHTVPAGAQKWTSLQMVGGKSVVVNHPVFINGTVISVGDELTLPYRTYTITFRVVDTKDNVLTLETKSVFGSSSAYKSIQFDGVEALYFAEEGLIAGIYNFTLPAGYEEAYGGGKTYQFTLTQNVPAGGCLMFPWGYQVQADTVKISSYASLTATTAIESVSVMEGSAGTSLGTADGNTPNMNHVQRARYGSNNYAQSAIRQWLNSSAGPGSVWAPKTKFDRPPTYHTSSDPAYAGFMNGLDPDFLAVVEAAVIPCRTNGIFEVNSLDGTEFAINQTYNLTDKFFLLSRPEIFGDWDSDSYKDGELLEFYDGLTNTERVKYDAFGADRRAWLRSPYPSYADFARYVNTDGSLYLNSAYVAYGAAAACRISNLAGLKTLIDNGTVTHTIAPKSLGAEIVSGNVDKVVSKDDDGTIIFDFTIPQVIQDLEGYGWSAGNVYNHLDFADKKLHNGKVLRIDLGSVSIMKDTTYSHVFRFSLPTAKAPAVWTTTANILCERYQTTHADALAESGVDKGIAITPTNMVWITDSAYTDAAALKAALSGVYLYYEAATEAAPVDVSEYLTDDNFIEVEAGGTVTFHQQDDIELSLPNTVTYMIKLEDAI